MKTYSAKPEQIERQWLVVDAAGKPMGRLAVEIAKILRGKNKPIFTPNVDTGDFVIVVNASQIVLTGRKEIVLRCGKASITLTRAGKVLLRGAYISSRSSGVNRLKGGSVQIN